MGVTRAVAGLVLLALILGARAESNCANCGLGEGDDPCNCGDGVVRAQKLAKPEFFVWPEAMINALKRKSNEPAPSPVYTSPEAASAQIVSAASCSADSSAHSAPPAPSPVSHASSSTPPPPAPPCTSKSYAQQITCRSNTGSCDNGIKRSVDNKDLKILLRLTPDTSIAPKFEPIGELCHSCKGYKNDNGINNSVIVVKPSTVPVLPPAYPTLAPTPVNSKDTSASSCNAPAAFAQYAPAYQIAVPDSYSPLCVPPSQKTTTAPAQYQHPAPATYEQTASAPPAKRSLCNKPKTQSDYHENEQEAQAYVKIALPKSNNSQGKKHVSADGRIFKRVCNFDEEKLHTIDKPVIELKCRKCGSSHCQNLRTSYGHLGYGPVAHSKNRFVPKADDAINPPYGQTIIYEDKNSLPCDPLGSTIPGYKAGSVIHGNSNTNPSTCGCCCCKTAYI